MIRMHLRRRSQVLPVIPFLPGALVWGCRPGCFGDINAVTVQRRVAIAHRPGHRVRDSGLTVPDRLGPEVSWHGRPIRRQRRLELRPTVLRDHVASDCKRAHGQIRSRRETGVELTRPAQARACDKVPHRDENLLGDEKPLGGLANQGTLPGVTDPTRSGGRGCSLSASAAASCTPWSWSRHGAGPHAQWAWGSRRLPGCGPAQC